MRTDTGRPPPPFSLVTTAAALLALVFAPSNGAEAERSPLPPPSRPRLEAPVAFGTANGRLRRARTLRDAVRFSLASVAASSAPTDHEAGGGGCGGGGGASSHLGRSVRVYDGVFPSPDDRDELRRLAAEHSDRACNSDGSSVFDRPPSPSRPLTPLESSIDSILTALGDDSPHVEYWSRDEFLNLDAHADVDEGDLEERDAVRCPHRAHVLYLDVEDGLRGPTCVFADRLGGWGGSGGAEKPGDGATKAEETMATTTEMVTVPAVPGRLLRFDGGALHAVPRPADRWLLGDDEEWRLRFEAGDLDFSDEAEEEEDDDDGDDDDSWLDAEVDEDAHDIHEDLVRSVLLFNCWRDAPPRAVDADPATGAMPSGIELVEEDADERGEEAWEDAVSAPLCEDRSSWTEVKPSLSLCASSAAQGDTIPVRVSLMGNARRRGHPSRFARLLGPPSLCSALGESAEVSVVQLLDSSAVSL